MSSALTLTDEEISLIRGMRAHCPELSKQAVLAYFSRPGRDINHRVIAEIDDGWPRPHVTAASAAEVDRFMGRIEATWGVFRQGPATGSGSGWRRLLLDWWPVGQGLFASGAIADGPGAPLNWVYDCGTSSKDAILENALRAFADRQDSIGAHTVRLCAVSHFDHDHISGIIRLLEHFPVQTLLLPYLPLWRRLVVALRQGIGADDDFLDFFLDPVAWLADRSGGRIGEIIFVPSSGPDGALPALPPDEGDSPGDREIDLKRELGEPPADAAGDPASAPHAGGIPVRFLRPGGRLSVPLLWEFVPYNDASLAPRASRRFKAAVTSLAATLRDDRRHRAQALKDLKALYDNTFGKTSAARNLISLFLYCGPLGARMRLGAGWGAGPSLGADAFSQLHTGDGTLTAGSRYDAFARFYGVGGRLRRAKIFQVMHHGAETSWHRGLAAKIAPDVAIFSSNPTDRRYRHPRANVLRDFWPYGPRQVDSENGYELQRTLIY